MSAEEQYLTLEAMTVPPARPNGHTAPISVVPTEFEALQQCLATERSAGKALLATVRSLEQRLQETRAELTVLEQRGAQLDTELADERERVTGLRVQNAGLWEELSSTMRRLSELEQRSFWRRVLDR